MKRSIFIIAFYLLLIGNANSCFAQSNSCVKILRKGQEYLRQNPPKLKAAQECFRYLEACDFKPELEKERKMFLDSIYLISQQQTEREQKLKNKAIQAEKDAVLQRDAATRAKKEAEIQRDIAKKERDIAHQERDRVKKEKKVSEWAASAASAREKNFTQAYWVADKACQQSYFLNKAATEIRSTIWSDFDNLFYKQSFFHPLGVPLSKLAVSPNSKYLIAGFSDGTVRIWDIESGELYFQYQKKFPEAISGVSISDKAVVVIASRDVLYLYPNATDNAPFSLSNLGQINSVSISKDSRFLAVSSSEKGAFLIDLEGVFERFKTEKSFLLAEYLQALQGHANEISHVSFSADSRYIGTASMDKTAHVYALDGRSNTLKDTLQGHAAALNSIEFSQDGRYIVTTSDDKTIRIWNTMDGKPIGCWFGHKSAPFFAAFVPNSDFLVSCTEQGEAFVWNRNGQILFQLLGHGARIKHAAIARNGIDFFTGDENGVIRRWLIKPRTFSGNGRHEKPILSTCFAGDNMIVTAGTDQTIKVWDRWNGDCIRTLKGHHGDIKCVDVSANGQMILSGGRDNVARLWSIDGPLLHTFEGHTGTIYTAHYMPDGKHIITGSSDGTLRFWDITTGKETERLPFINYGIKTLCVAPDGNAIFVGGDQSNVVMYWRKKGNHWLQPDTFQYVVNGEPFPVSEVTISKNGQYLLITGGSSAMVRNLNKKREIRLFAGDNTFVSGCFSPVDENTILLCDKTGFCYISKLQTRVLSLLFWHNNAKNATFSPDGNVILTAGYDANAKLTDLSGNQQMVFGGTSHPINQIFYDPDLKMTITADILELTCWDSLGNFIRKWTKNKIIKDVTYAKGNVWVVCADSTINTYNLSDGTYDSSPFELNLDKANLCMDGTKIIVQSDKNSVVLDLISRQSICEDSTGRTFGWINQDYFFFVDQPKKQVTIFNANQPKSQQIFKVREVDEIVVTVSSNNEQVLIAGKTHGWLYLYDRKTRQLEDSVKLENNISQIRFIDDHHFVIMSGDRDGATIYLHGITQDLSATTAAERRRWRMTPALQIIKGSSGSLVFNPDNNSLIVSNKNRFVQLPLALMDAKPPIDTLRPPEFAKYNLETDHFTAAKRYKTNLSPGKYKIAITDLAMYQMNSGEQDRYFNKSVRLVGALHYAQEANDSAFIEVIQGELDDLDIQIMSGGLDGYDESQILAEYKTDLNQYLHDAFVLDTGYNKLDPQPLYRAYAADRYSSAAYQLIFLNKPLEAIKYAKKAMKLDPSKTWANTNLALGYLFADSIESAKRIYREWMAKDWHKSGFPIYVEYYNTFWDGFCADKQDLENLSAQFPKQFSHIKKYLPMLEAILQCDKKLAPIDNTITNTPSVVTTDAVPPKLPEGKPIPSSKAAKGSSTDTIKPSPEKTKIPVNNRVYAVLSGAYPTKEEAEKQLSTVKLAGFKRAYIKIKDKRYQVIVQDNLSWEETLRIEKQLRDLRQPAGHLYKTVKK